MAQNGLLDFLQGASNAAASNVSAPVDGIAWALRKAGIPVPDAPVGGSDWMAQRGLTAEPQNKIAGLLGESFGGVAPIVAAAKAPQIANGLLGMMENAVAPSTLNKQAGAVYLPKGGLSSNLDDANRLAEEIRSMGFIPKVDVDRGGSVYVTAARNNLNKSGSISKVRPEIPIEGFKARFADHPSYWSNSISSDPFTGNSVDDAINQFAGFVKHPSFAPKSVLTEAKFSPADRYGEITEYTTRKAPSLSGKSIVNRTTSESRPFSFLSDRFFDR